MVSKSTKLLRLGLKQKLDEIAGSSKNSNGESPRIVIHDEGGTTVDGASTPPGSIEVIGSEIHFSEIADTDTSDPSFSYSNLSISNQFPSRFESVDIAVDVSNNGGAGGVATVTLAENGDVVATDEVYVGSGATKTVTFTRAYALITKINVNVNGLAGEIQVTPSGI